jgi:hypothetical protein
MGEQMKVYILGLIATLFMLTTSCQTLQQLQSQQQIQGICSEKFISCPQSRNYSVTYDTCCSFPVTYKTKERKKIVVIPLKERKIPSFSTMEE